MARCWSVTQTLASKPSRASRFRYSGQSLIASGRVPKTSRTRTIKRPLSHTAPGTSTEVAQELPRGSCCTQSLPTRHVKDACLFASDVSHDAVHEGVEWLLRCAAPCALPNDHCPPTIVSERG